MNWLSDLLQGIPLNTVLRERLALAEQKLKDMEAENKRLKEQVIALTEENETLKKMVEQAPVAAVASAEAAQEIDIAVTGRWHAKVDHPDSRFGPDKMRDGNPTPGKVIMKPGEVYMFVAGFGITDEEFKKLVPLAALPQLRWLVLYRCTHLSPESL